VIRQKLTFARILVVDDHEANVRLLARLLETWDYRDVVSTTNSSEVIELCARTAPDLVLLDLQMPVPDGFELLERLRRDIGPRTRLPILVVTADITEEAMERALTLGASDFVTKPFAPVELRLRIANLLESRRLTLELNGHNDVLERRVRDGTRDLDDARLETLERLALAAEYRDDNTHEHAQRVGRTCALLGEQREFAAEDIELLRRAAPLHDIGKIGISDSILLKPGKLTDDEFEHMKTHTTIGAQILAGSASPVLELSERIALSHHERWDGHGYPQGLAEAEIPLAGRLVAIADVFDALMHQRPYKDPWPLDAALEEIRRGEGTHFDPSLVAAFEQLDHEALLAPIAEPLAVPV
jgi:putative two-component system response regulator